MINLLSKISVRLFIIYCLLLASLLIFWFIIHEVFIEKEDRIDAGVMTFLSGHVTHSVTRVMRFITFLASSEFLIPSYILLVGYFIFHQKRKIMALAVILTGTTGFLLVFLLKNIFRRQRPLQPLVEKLTDFSFPSGHTTAGFIFYGLLIYLVWKSKWKQPLRVLLCLLLLFISLLVGLSRIYLGMHYPTDVVAGLVLGFVWLSFSIMVVRRLTPANTYPDAGTSS